MNEIVAKLQAIEDKLICENGLKSGIEIEVLMPFCKWIKLKKIIDYNMERKADFISPFCGIGITIKKDNET